MFRLERTGPVARAAGFLILSLAVLAPLASAQTEWVYGPTASSDQGSRRVSAVSAACGGGFVSVGTGTASGTVNSNVYVVRTTAAGAAIWELQYDIGPGGVDRGESIAVLASGTGFVVTGSTRPATGGQADAFLMRLDCAGNVVWLNVYASGLHEEGLDVIEARTGDAAFGTAIGDLVVAGRATNPAGDTDAMIFRVRATGILLWSRRYDVGNARDHFRALTEARAIAPALTGDIVAVGSWNAGAVATGEQGYVARVNGNNGTIGAAPQCAALYGDANTQRFEAVTDLRNTLALNNQLVLAGLTTSAAGGNDIYLVRTQPNPCLWVQQRRIGDPITSNLGDELLFGLREVLNPVAIAPTGRLALTGSVGTASTSVLDNDAFLLIADQTTLAPTTGRRYGDHATRQEVGVSVFPHAAGFTIAGFNDADPQAVGDPRDLYLINAGGGGQTSCELIWNPTHVTLGFVPTPVTPLPVSFLTQTPMTQSIIPLGTGFQSCP